MSGKQYKIGVISMAIATTSAHVSRALDFFNKSDHIFFAIGRTTPWPNDSDDNTEMEANFQPPAEDIEATALDDVIGYKKVESIYLVVPDENGEIVYDEQRWRVVSPDNAYTEKAKFVFIETTIRYDELPLGFYRQVGVYTGLTRKEGVSSAKFNLLPEEVEDAGVLEILSNRKPSNRQADQKETINLVIEF